MAQPRRTKKFIDATVQGSLARRIIFHWMVFLGVASIAAFILQVLSNPFQPLATHIRAAWFTHGPFVLVMLFMLPVFVVDSIKLSHRFAGPIYNMRRAMREIVQGKPARRLKFRKHDFWHDLAETYNAMLLRLELLDDEEEPEAAEQPLAAASK